MKNLFFVSVAFSIFSGTSLSATAQRSVNFIEGIEINAGPALASTAPLPVSPSTEVLTTAGNKTSASTEMFSGVQFKYAQIMDTEVENVTNKTLYEFIDDWFGTRYRYGGTTKKGVDCSSLTLQLVNSVYGIALPRTARAQYAATERIKENELQEGDLVFFNTTGGISHVGLFLGNGYFVHAGSSTGVTISRLDDTYFNKRYRGAGRIIPSASQGMAKSLL